MKSENHHTTQGDRRHRCRRAVEFASRDFGPRYHVSPLLPMAFCCLSYPSHYQCKAAWFSLSSLDFTAYCQNYTAWLSRRLNALSVWNYTATSSEASDHGELGVLTFFDAEEDGHHLSIAREDTYLPIYAVARIGQQHDLGSRWPVTAWRRLHDEHLAENFTDNL